MPCLTCSICQGMNHFAIKCRSTSQRQQRPARKVKNVTLASTPISQVGLYDDSRNGETAVPPVKTLSAHETGTAGNRQRETVDRVEMDRNVGYTTLVVGSHKVKFECDTGSQCSILPLRDYKLATGDDNLQQITQTADTITVYGGRKISDWKRKPASTQKWKKLRIALQSDERCKLSATTEPTSLHGYWCAEVD